MHTDAAATHDAASASELSAYENLRLSNMARNNELLRSMGITGPLLAPSLQPHEQQQKRAAKKKRPNDTGPSRKSARIQEAPPVEYDEAKIYRQQLLAAEWS